MSFFQRMLAAQMKRLNTDSAMWAFPALVGFGWFLWPAIDYEWKMEMGLAPDPEAAMNRVYNAKLARMEAVKIAKQGGGGGGADGSGSLKVAAEKEEEEEQEEEEEGVEAEEEQEEVAAEEEEEKEGEAATGDDDVPAMEDGDADEEEAEEEEESELKFKPLYVPTKAKKLGPKEIWDNFTIKALNMSEDDDGT
jgi:hypothetical protein